MQKILGNRLELDWEELMRIKKVQERYNIFMEVYKTGVTRFVLKYRPREKKGKEKERKHGKD